MNRKKATMAKWFVVTGWWFVITSFDGKPFVVGPFADSATCESNRAVVLSAQVVLATYSLPSAPCWSDVRGSKMDNP